MGKSLPEGGGEIMVFETLEDTPGFPVNPRQVVC